MALSRLRWGAWRTRWSSTLARNVLTCSKAIGSRAPHSAFLAKVVIDHLWQRNDATGSGGEGREGGDCVDALAGATGGKCSLDGLPSERERQPFPGHPTRDRVVAKVGQPI